MNDDRRKMLTEYVGEVWVEHDNPNQQIYVGKVCIDKSTLSNHSFTTWADLGAVYSKMVEMKNWDGEFIVYAITEWQRTNCFVDADVGEFSAWLFCLNHPEQIADRMELAAEFLEGRHDNK